MYEKYDFGSDQGDLRPIVYVREVAVRDLPEELREEIGDIDRLYAVHSADGERLALVRDRAMAFVLARQNDFAPVAVH